MSAARPGVLGVPLGASESLGNESGHRLCSRRTLAATHTSQGGLGVLQPHRFQRLPVALGGPGQLPRAHARPELREGTGEHRYLTVVGVPLGLAFELVLAPALALNLRVRGLPLYRAVVYLPTIIPLAVTTY